MKKLFVPLIILLSTSLAFAQNTVTHAVIAFKVKNIGIYANGTIGGLQTTVHFDPSNLASSSLQASVDVNTINTDNSMRDDHLKSDEFFDPARYPKITLKSVSFKHKSGNNYAGQFNLTIKDKTRLVEIPFTYVDKGNSVAFNSTFKLNRLDYGVGSDSFTLSNDVTVTIDAEAAK